MKVNELKAILKGCDDNLNVVVDDVAGQVIQIVGGGEVSKAGLHLSVRQEFPESWFENGEEVIWIKGKAVIPKAIEETEEILLHDEDIFNSADEFSFKLVFKDGHASGHGVYLKYPKLSELTDSQIEAVDEYCGGRISDSGVITPFDVCLLYGKVMRYDGIMDNGNGHNRELVKEINKKWLLFKEKFRPILCALYERDIDEITDADSFQIDRWRPDRADGCSAEIIAAFYKGKTTGNWARYNELALEDMVREWDSFAENYLMHIADDQDLETILTYVRYDKCEE